MSIKKLSGTGIIIASRAQFSDSKAKTKRIALLLKVSWLYTMKTLRKHRQNIITIVTAKNIYAAIVLAAKSNNINVDRKYARY